MKKSKVLSIILAAGLLATSFAGCSTEKRNTSTTSAGKYATAETWNVFDTFGNYQGIQSGWFAKVVKDKFNVTLNIIAPNVAGGGDTLFDTRSAAGNLGDLIMIGQDKLQNTIKAGLLFNMATLMKDHGSYLSKYQLGVSNIQSVFKTGTAIYAIPCNVTTQSPTIPSEGQEPVYGAYLRWDYYQAIGSPKLNTIDDLLPVLKEMQQKFPKSDSGKKTYAFSLFKDWDGDYMGTVKQIANMYGYDGGGNYGFLLANNDCTKTQDILDPNGYYVKALKLYFQANQEGLLDPDSPTQNYTTLFSKYQDGQILFSNYSFTGPSAYNTDAHKAEGKGYMMIPIADEKIFSYGCNKYGNTYTVEIGSKAKDPARVMDFINWLYSPEGLEYMYDGPKGLTWEIKDGKPVETSFGLTALPNSKVTVSADWGGGTYSGGIDPFDNIWFVIGSEKDPNTGEPYDYTQWASTITNSMTKLQKSWNTAENASCAKDYLVKQNQIAVEPGNNYINPIEDSTLQAEENQCKSVVLQYSWKMCFAKDQATFDSLLKQMTAQVKGLGYDDLIKFDQSEVDSMKAARANATKLASK